MAVFNPDYLIEEVQTLLGYNDIARTDAQVDYALQSAAEREGEVEGGFVPADVIHGNPMHWHDFVYGPAGVFDLLEIDVEDRLYDRTVHPR